MKRLYKFFFLLFLAFLVISFIYGTLISWLTLQAIIHTKFLQVKSLSIPFENFLGVGLVQGALYALVLLLFTIFLFNRSYKFGRPFSIRHIIKTTAWFFVVTTVVYLIFYLTFPNVSDIYQFFIVNDPYFILPPLLWYPFPLAWIILLWLLAVRIKKTE